MKPSLMARNSQDSASKRHFHWTNKVSSEHEEQQQQQEQERLKPAQEDNTTNNNRKKQDKKKTKSEEHGHDAATAVLMTKRRLQAIAVSKLRSVLFTLAKARPLGGGGGNAGGGLGPRVVGTIFGHRRGHVQFALQKDAASRPAFLVDLATPISGLVREMASGLVRIALECDKRRPETGHSGDDNDKNSQSNGNNSRSNRSGGGGPRLLEETLWRTYCNGKKCGYAARRECGPKEWKVLKAVEPISMGAGVLPASDEDGDGGGSGTGGDDDDHGEDQGEMMYMRAKFERIVGSRDCEAFYMMNPDCNGAPELSIYLLRV